MEVLRATRHTWNANGRAIIYYQVGQEECVSKAGIIIHNSVNSLIDVKRIVRANKTPSRIHWQRSVDFCGPIKSEQVP